MAKKTKIDEPKMELKVAPLPIQKAYTIHESELDNLSKGTPVQYYFSISIFLLSLSGSLIGSLLYYFDENIRFLIKPIFYLSLILLALGIVLFVVWSFKSIKAKGLAKIIKGRLLDDSSS
jgi:hypothetical protein